MDDSATGPVPDKTLVEHRSALEIVVMRTFDAPARILFEAWTNADLFRQWWVPRSFGATLLMCEMDVRVGGGYRLEFGHAASEQPMAFFGRYLDVVPGARIVWTNDESADGAITTVTFAERDGRTLQTISNLFPSKAALEAEIGSGASDGMGETLDQLAAIVVTLLDA